MKKEIIEIYVCDFCGIKHESEDWMKTHEEVCLKNPKNQPCSECENQLIGVGCMCGMNMDVIGGNVYCFRYKKGEPKTMQDFLLGDNNEK